MRRLLSEPAVLTRRTAIVLTIVSIVFFAVIGWASDRNSCVRQAIPREAGNARKAAIDELVKAVAPNIPAAERAVVLAKTQAVPTVPTLRCNRLFPETE